MDAQLAKYQKDLADFSIEYNPAKAFHIKNRPFILQVSLGEMNLEDAFWVELEPSYLSKRTSEFLDLVFSSDHKEQAEVRSALDIKENPDLPDMYTELLEVFAEWRSGKSTLQFFANQGPEIRLTDRLVDHLSIMQSPKHRILETPLLDLVIEQNLDVLDYLADAGYFQDKETMMDFMQANMLMYFLDKHQYKLALEPLTDTDRQLLPIAKKLQSVKLIAPSDLDGTFAISEEGRQAIGRTIAETESYIDLYDVFKDVYLDADSEAPEFDTGRGLDLRVQIYEAQDLDLVRVVFLLRLYDSTFDEVQAMWRDSIHSEQFFGEMLSPIINAERVGEEVVEWILEAGYNINEERFEAARELESQQEIIKRMSEEETSTEVEVEVAPPLGQKSSPREVRPDVAASPIPASRDSGKEALPQEIRSEARLSPPEAEAVPAVDAASQPAPRVETPASTEAPSREPSGVETPQVAISPGSLEAAALTEEGKSLLDQGKARQAVDYFTRAIARDRSYKQAWLFRADAYDQLGRRASASGDRRQAATID